MRQIYSWQQLQALIERFSLKKIEIIALNCFNFLNVEPKNVLFLISLEFCQKLIGASQDFGCNKSLCKEAKKTSTFTCKYSLRGCNKIIYKKFRRIFVKRVYIIFQGEGGMSTKDYIGLKGQGGRSMDKKGYIIFFMLPYWRFFWVEGVGHLPTRASVDMKICSQVTVSTAGEGL